MSDGEGAARKKARVRRNFDSSDEEEEAGAAGDEKKAWRFNARKCFLTYAQCDVGTDAFPGLFPLWHEVKTCFAKSERHEDGKLHLHVFCAYKRKLNSTNVQMFDLVRVGPAGAEGEVAGFERFHPNVKRVPGPEDLVRAWEYLCKDGVPPTELQGRVDLYRFSKNFCVVYRDRESWLSYRSSVSQSAPVYPIIGPSGEVFGDPATAGKKRNLWLSGPANAGKTAWLEAQVYRFRNYKVGDSRYPFDNYAREQIIVYDDVKPRASDLLVLGNHSAYPRPVPGATRYHQRFIPGGLFLWTIVCSNKTLEASFEGEEREVIEALRARYIEVVLDPNVVVLD